MVPVADVEPIAVAQWVMAARFHRVGPWIMLAASLPLAGDPPAAHFDGLRRVGKIENHDDVADIAFGRRRDIGVASVEIETMNAAPGGAPFRDEFRVGRVLDVVDINTAAGIRR